MQCPYCQHEQNHVLDTRTVGDGIRLRRECQRCSERFTTYERVARAPLMIVKRDGRREEFDQDKLFVGLKKACTKRPVSIKSLDQIVDQIEGELYGLGQSEIPADLIGERVMNALMELDEVAYVRFASVYRRFADLESLADEIQKLKAQKALDAERKRQMALL